MGRVSNEVLAGFHPLLCSVAKVAPEAARLFYARLFEVDPAVRVSTRFGEWRQMMTLRLRAGAVRLRGHGVAGRNAHGANRTPASAHCSLLAVDGWKSAPPTRVVFHLTRLFVVGGAH